MAGSDRPSENRLFALNRDLFLRSIGMIAVYIGFTIISARYGDVMLAVSAILMKLLMFFSYFTDGFAYAGEALTGKFIGEGSEEGVRCTVRQTFLWGMAMACLFMLAYGAGGTPILRLMTEDTVVVEAGRQFLPWLLLMPLIGCPHGLQRPPQQHAALRRGFLCGMVCGRALRLNTRGRHPPADGRLLYASRDKGGVPDGTLQESYFLRYFQPITGSTKASRQATIQKMDTGVKL